MYGEKQKYYFSDIETIIDYYGGNVEMWEYTSNGFWFTFRFDDVFWNFNCNKINSIKTRLKEIGLEVIEHTYEVLEHDNDTGEYTVLHDMEVMF